MSWTPDNIAKLFAKISRKQKKDRIEWNEQFPPNMEIDIDEDLDIPTRYGLWKVEGGALLIQRSKNGYSPRKETIPI